MPKKYIELAVIIACLATVGIALWRHIHLLSRCADLYGAGTPYVLIGNLNAGCVVDGDIKVLQG